MGTHPFPDLRVYPTSGLDFPWAELQNTGVMGTFDASMGHDGVSLGMVMIIPWGVLCPALQRLLGYSWRDTSGHESRLRRVLPWQHPYFNQLWVKNITKIQGVRVEGTNYTSPKDGDESFFVSGGGSGKGTIVNTGPWTDYNLAILTIQFWRPPYYVRTDEDILDGNGQPQEWLRYVDKDWQPSSQMLSREGSTMVWRVNNNTNQGFPGTVGQVVGKYAIKRKWYEIPEAAIFSRLVDATPNGIPTNLTYTQTGTYNPITLGTNGTDFATGTNYFYPAGSPILGTVNSTKGGVPLVRPGNLTSGSPVIPGISTTVGLEVGFTVDGAGPQNAVIVSVDSGTQVTISSNATYTQSAATLVFENPLSKFMGCNMGTLLLDHIQIIPRPLHLPPWLMQIPNFAMNEPVSQQQYDVEFNFVLFEPSRNIGEPFRGHNLMPWAGNGLWKSVRAQKDVTNTPPGETGPFTTPFQYADFSDLFKIL